MRPTTDRRSPERLAQLTEAGEHAFCAIDPLLADGSPNPAIVYGADGRVVALRVEILDTGSFLLWLHHNP